MKRSKQTIFLNFLVSYIIIFMIPLFILGFFVYNHFVSALQQEVERSNQNMLVHSKDNLDKTMRQMKEIAIQISNNPELTPYALGNNPYQAMLAKNMLNYSVVQDFIREVLLYVRGRDMLYSAFSTYELDRFHKDIYPYKNWPLEQMRQDLNRLSEPLLRPAEELAGKDPSASRLLTYMIPIPVNSVKPYGTAVFIIDEQSIQTMLGTLEQGSKGFTSIYDERGQLITTTGKAAVAGSIDPGVYVQPGDSGFRTIQVKHEGSEYLISIVTSDYTGWTYCTVVPLQQVMSAVTGAKNRALAGLTFVIVCGIVVIYMIMHVNYNPLRKIIHAVEGYAGKGIRNFSEMRQGIAMLAESNDMLAMEVNQSRPAVRQYFLFQVLKGGFSSREEFVRQAEVVGVGIAAERCSFCVVAILTPDGVLPDPEEQRRLLEELDDHMHQVFRGYRVQAPMENRRVYLLFMDGEDDVAVDRLEQMQRMLYDQYEREITVGVGGVCREPDAVGKSYLEASTAIDYRLIKGTHQIIYYRDVSSEQDLSEWYPKRELETFELVVRQGEQERIKQVLNDVLHQIEGKRISLHTARCICYEMVGIVIRLAYGAKPKSADHEVPDVLGLMKYNTIQELADMVVGVCFALSREESQSEEEHVRIRNELLAFVESNYGDWNFSAQTMADRFGLSASYMKRYFKEYTGRTMTEVLNEVRMEEAKRLLKEEETPLKTIIQTIGYYDTSSFIRKFKQETRLTPGEYRKLHRMER
ncbi:helix-turn-helix domain-containing protein [Paenibacillus cymbidii]|uniref:helix-turn-helix domain-containing protein n=1 Tax=Paenibacillus cymbidii TaxID=1639034 RepID=UPI0010800B27|nr:helix-turn-helix domain-containing protein [Paenibacillus cymbidii]